MDELITTFHIDWKLMIAQIVNFGLVFAALYLIAAKPLAKLIKDRNKEITDGLENAEKASLELKNANLQKEEIIKDAKKDATKILVASEKDGKDIIKDAKDKANLEKEEIIKQARIDAEKEKKHAKDEVNKEAAELVSDGIKKLIENYVAKGHGDDIIKGMIINK